MFSRIISKTMTSVVARNFATKKPVKVAITGAAGQIGYSLLFRIANGDMLGKDQPVSLHLVDIPVMVNALKGVAMELEDCAFPLLQNIVCTDDLSVGFKDISYALLVGAKPRGPGMERSDLLKDNGKIFIGQGKALNDHAARDCRVIVVGNPANTNCLIAAHYAKDLPKANFTAMTRLDHNRALFQLKTKTGTQLEDIKQFCIWGNHSSTMYPDIFHTTIKGKQAFSLVNQTWVDKEFIPIVQKRGAAIIAARKLSSAASAANAAIEHIRDWALGCNGWQSMGIPSDGSYGIPKDLIFSYPVTCKGGKYEIVQGLKISPVSQKMIDITTKELLEERDAVAHLLK